jgi:hypothetical protein
MVVNVRIPDNRPGASENEAICNDGCGAESDNDGNRLEDNRDAGSMPSVPKAVKED